MLANRAAPVKDTVPSEVLWCPFGILGVHEADCIRQAKGIKMKINMLWQVYFFLKVLDYNMIGSFFSFYLFLLSFIQEQVVYFAPFSCVCLVSHKIPQTQK